MTERGFENERKPLQLFDTCNNCKTRYKITADNATGAYYEQQEECSNLICTCPNCKQQWRIFVDRSTIEQAIELGIPIEDDNDVADAELYDRWVKANGIELSPTYELTDRHEALVQKFGESIMAMPDELLTDGFSTPSERPYPERWI